MNIKEILENVEDDTIPTIAIDYVDDLLAQLDDKELYGIKGDMLRYILQRLQEQ